jgi:endogenous inhibitor of DNA gyrase (YacG/DUF329 family)
MAARPPKKPPSPNSELPKNRVTCPICQRAMPGATAEWPESPFCSARCKMVDLGRWLGETYRFEPETAAEDSLASDDESVIP